MLTFLLALSLSIDALAVGLSLGAGGIRVSRPARALVCALAAGAAFASMQAGSLLTVIFSPLAAKIIGGVVLLCIGLWLIASGLLKSSLENSAATGDAPLFEMAFRSLGITLRILRSPQSSDTDRSGVIELPEALPLGLALSVDMLGTGVGIGAMGVASPLLPLAVGAFQTLFLYIGEKGGARVSGAKSRQGAASLVAGVILVFLSLLRML